MRASYTSAMPCLVKPKGFMLIELLVVIAIISLLVSILLPSLTKARELARSTVCMVKLSHFKLAMELYSQDNDGYIVCTNYDWWPAGYPKPSWVNYTATNGAAGHAATLLMPYLGDDRESFHCPSDTLYYEHWERTSYIFNLYLSCSFWNLTGKPARTDELRALDDADRIMLWGCVPMYLDEPMRHINQDPWPGFGSEWSGNFLFLDGHVDSLVAGFWNWPLKMD